MALMREEKAVIEQQLRNRERDLHCDVDELHAIGRAIQSIREGEYGHCLDCGADIPFARLLVAPTALRCVRCQQRGATP